MRASDRMPTVWCFVLQQAVCCGRAPVSCLGPVPGGRHHSAEHEHCAQPAAGWQHGVQWSHHRRAADQLHVLCAGEGRGCVQDVVPANVNACIAWKHWGADVTVRWPDGLLSCGCAVQLVTSSSLAVCDQYGAIMEVRSGRTALNATACVCMHQCCKCGCFLFKALPVVEFGCACSKSVHTAVVHGLRPPLVGFCPAQAIGASERVLTHLNDQPAPQLAPGLKPHDQLRGEVELKSVSYTYPNRCAL